MLIQSMNMVEFHLSNEKNLNSCFHLGGFQPPGGVDSRTGYNPRSAYPANGARGGMYPIQPLPPLVDVSHGDGGSLGRFTNTALLTSTRVSAIRLHC